MDLGSCHHCYYFFFIWGIVVLQCCVGFCHTTKWISYMCMYICPLPLKLPSHPHPSHPFLVKFELDFYRALWHVHVTLQTCALQIRLLQHQEIPSCWVTLMFLFCLNLPSAMPVSTELEFTVLWRALVALGRVTESKYTLLLSNAGLFQWTLIVANFQKGKQIHCFSNRFSFKNHTCFGSGSWNLDASEGSTSLTSIFGAFSSYFLSGLVERSIGWWEKGTSGCSWPISCSAFSHSNFFSYLLNLCASQVPVLQDGLSSGLAYDGCFISGGGTLLWGLWWTWGEVGLKELTVLFLALCHPWLHS